MTSSNSPAASYHQTIASLIDAIASTQGENIVRAAGLLADQVAADRLIHVFGVGGHSFIASEEMFWRAGGLANISPIYDLSLNVAAGGRKSTMLERVEGYGNRIIESRDLGPDDVLIITSAYGMNACTIDAALEAKRRGCKLISASSWAFAEATPAGFPARHSSNNNLHELADVPIDNKIPHGETVVRLAGLDQMVGGTCGLLASYCVQWLSIETVNVCLQRGIEPPVWKSANIIGGDAHNQTLFARFANRVKAL
jgi:uncharacterized phosphosugar-binding protein